MSAEAEQFPRSADVPELVKVAWVQRRGQEVDRARGDVARDLRVACYEASQVTSVALIASCMGVSRQRVMKLVEQGRQIVADETKGAETE